MTAQPIIGVDIGEAPAVPPDFGPQPPSLPERLAYTRASIQAAHRSFRVTALRPPVRRRTAGLTPVTLAGSAIGTVLVAIAIAMVFVPAAIAYVGVATLVASVVVSREARR